MEGKELLGEFKKEGANANQLFILNSAIEFGLSIEELAIIKNTNLSTAHMTQILEGFKYGISLEKVKVYAKVNENNEPVFNAAQMEQLFLAYKDGLSNDEIERLLDSSFNAKTMNELRKSFVLLKENIKNPNEDEVLNLKKTLEIVQTQYERIQELDNEYRSVNEFIRQEYEAVKKKNEELLKALEEKDHLIDSLVDQLNDGKAVTIESESRKISVNGFVVPLPESGKSFAEKTILSREPLEETEPKEIPAIQNIDKEPTEKKISLGSFFNKALKKFRFEESEREKVHKIFGNSKLNPKQMEQIRFGLESGLTLNEVLIYAKENLTAEQMEQSRLIIEIQKQRGESYV